jgi:hypothetical protein
MGGRWRRNCRDRRSQLAKHIWSSPEVAVLDIDDAPSTLKPKPVRVAIAAAAAMVHVEHTNAASRPVLRRKRERARCGRRWRSMTLYQDRRPFAFRRRKLGRKRRIA